MATPHGFSEPLRIERRHTERRPEEPGVGDQAVAAPWNASLIPVHMPEVPQNGVASRWSRVPLIAGCGTFLNETAEPVP
jgi:hypothetical protein